MVTGMTPAIGPPLASSAGVPLVPLPPAFAFSVVSPAQFSGVIPWTCPNALPSDARVSSSPASREIVNRRMYFLILRMRRYVPNSSTLPKAGEFRPGARTQRLFGSRAHAGLVDSPHPPTRCRALGCERSKVPRGSHCRVHEPEWFAIERLQRDFLARGYPPSRSELAELRARRDAMGMIWPPRNLRD